MIPITITHILLVFHIIAAGVWIAQFPAEMILNRLIKRNEGNREELTYTLLYGQLMSGMGSIGGMGILFTGLGLAGIDRYGVFNIGGVTPDWLLIKQIVFVVAMVMVFALVQPMAKKIFPEFAKAAAGGGTVTSEVRAQFSRLKQVSMVINLLVFVNIVLAVWGPGPTP